MIDDLRGRLQAAEPAIHTDFGQLIEDDIGDLTGGVPQPIDIKVFGSDPVLLAGLGREIATILTTVRGVEDAFDGVVIAGPALQVRVDPVAAARYGLTTTDIQAAVEPALTGTVVDQVRVGDRMYDLRIFARPGGGGPLADLRIRAQSNPGALIPLSTLAAVSTGAPEAEINRENLQTFDVDYHGGHVSRGDLVEYLAQFRLQGGGFETAAVTLRGDDQQVGQDDLPQVMADSDAMKRAIANLVDNAAEAVQASAVKEIEISTSLVPDHDLVRSLAAGVGPLATTSANRHGQPTPSTARAAAVGGSRRTAGGVGPPGGGGGGRAGDRRGAGLGLPLS